MIQKRKYTKGFYLNRHSSGKAADDAVTGDVSVKEEKTARIRPESQPAAAENQTVLATVETPQAAETATPEITAPEAQASALDRPAGAQSDIAITDEPAVTARPDAAEHEQKAAVSSGDQSAAAVESALLVILLVILAFFLPWLSVLLYEGATGRFWIILLLWLLAIIGFFWPIAYALAVIAVVYAILIVLGIV